MKADHCGFQVKSMDEAIHFYTQKLGFQLDHRAINQQEQEEYAFVSLGTARLELIQDLVNEYIIPTIRKPFCPHYCLEVLDMASAVADLQAKGIPIVKGPLLIEGEETWVYFSDPDNNLLEYIQWFNKK
ncbi:VOC family protein [Spirosoma radiotolerans]|uniref:Glyoxalase n=1 Tax=Spirosoma radiotolerans TaxID=1379870 RepID=A0A0E3V7J5_9BACT|nr:VOC family protein [Spirosoma radiotolerans]AKD55481.1 glyoxalase [Spirosoma radiotolerans]